MPRVSVIIPTYNRAASLPNAVDSVIEQTVDDLEVLVVDDGSTDSTGAVIAGYEDPRVRSVVHATNRGANAARNTGLDHARGEYVAFLDSDDVWSPEKLERQLSALEGRSDEWVGAYCDTTFALSGPIDRLRGRAADVLARADDRPTAEGGEELIGEILAGNVQPGAGSTLLVRTDVARDVGGFDEALDRFQDPDFCLRVLAEGKLAYVDEQLVVREETGHPSADVVREADRQYLAKHAAAVERFEAEGYEIRSSHELIVTKSYLTEARFLRGAWHLRKASASPRYYPGVLWTAGAGVRRRPTATVAAVCVALLLVLAGASRTAPRLRTLDEEG